MVKLCNSNILSLVRIYVTYHVDWWIWIYFTWKANFPNISWMMEPNCSVPLQYNSTSFSCTVNFWKIQNRLKQIHLFFMFFIMFIKTRIVHLKNWSSCWSNQQTECITLYYIVSHFSTRYQVFLFFCFAQNSYYLVYNCGFKVIFSVLSSLCLPPKNLKFHVNILKQWLNYL